MYIVAVHMASCVMLFNEVCTWPAVCIALFLSLLLARYTDCFLIIYVLVKMLIVNCPGSLHVGDAIRYRKNCFVTFSHHILYEGVTLYDASFVSYKNDIVMCDCWWEYHLCI